MNLDHVITVRDVLMAGGVVVALMASTVFFVCMFSIWYINSGRR